MAASCARDASSNDGPTILALLAEIDGECRVALEATYGWEWLADVLQDAGYELHLAHPLGTKAIASAGVKNDAVDAGTLAHLLRTGLLPEAYIAPRELRELRDLLRHRVALTGMRSALKNRAGAMLAKRGVRRPFGDMFGPGGLRFVEALEPAESPRRRLDSTLALVADFTREIELTTREIDARAREDPYVEVLSRDSRRGPLHRHARDRRGRRRQPLPDGAAALLLGRDDPDRAHIRPAHAARPHLPPGLAGAALGARRGRPTRRPRRRSAAPGLRADLKTPRPPGRESRGRAQDPHALLLRPARRRDPLPRAAGRRTPAKSNGGHPMIRHGAHALHGPPASGSSGQLACCQWPLLAQVGDRRPPP